MKKIVLSLCLICLSVFGFSQTFGVRGGINVAQQVWKINGEKMRSTTMVGALTGIGLNFQQGDKTSGQLELSYSEMGFGETNIGDSIRVLAGKYKYLKFGCAFKYYVLSATNLHAGAEIGFQFERVKDLQYLYNPDFGLFIGAEQYMGPYIGIGLRYYIGVSDISNIDADDSGISSLKQLNRTLQIYLTFRIPSKQLKEMGY